jgi:hypothetical protein
MPETRVQRTLVKSPPELWAEISDAAALARRLEAFGEVRITRLEPETAVAWEGETARGTVELEPSGWGTKVSIAAEAVAPEQTAPEPATEAATAPEPATEASTATEPAADAATEPAEHAAPEPATEAATAPEAGTAPDPTPAPRPGFLRRLFQRRRTQTHAIEPAATTEPDAEPVAPETDPETTPEKTPEPVAPPEVEPEITARDTADLDAALAAILDDLGSAHHRPFSRS